MRRKTVEPVSLASNGYVILRASAIKSILPDSNFPEINDETRPVEVKGRLLALDLGTKRVGVAVSDELQLTTHPLPPLGRTNWKKLLRQITDLRHSFDAQGVVIGLPLNLDGSEGDAAQEARRIARNLSLSLSVPVHLQDERLTSHAAEASLREAGVQGDELTARLDSEAAALILRDFIVQQDRQP
ncbi:MAG: putative pre6S rRNA nuclease [Pyrinomonadaceae bacterium]|jgi:putative Holliday junction resolvase|nr:putative pre6S rRNA nuclease [Pyrinomonadaceae bacterium]